MSVEAAVRPERRPWHLWVVGGVGPLLFTALIFVVAVGLWRYARAMAERGVLA